MHNDKTQMQPSEPHPSLQGPSFWDRYRRSIIVGIHLTLALLSNGIALHLGSAAPETLYPVFLQFLPLLLFIRGMAFGKFQLYGGLWRYAGFWDLRNIIASAVSSSLIFAIAIFFLEGWADYPLSIMTIDTILLVSLLGGARFLRRMIWVRQNVTREKRVLIYGAGNAGEMILRDIQHNVAYPCEPIGFIDDDPKKTGLSIHGVSILGTGENIAQIMESYTPSEVLIAMPGSGPATLQKVFKSFEPFHIPIKTLPNLRGMMEGKVTVSQIRNLLLEDLLDRAPVGLDPAPLEGMIRGQRVMVTGAGGSIGAELCRQIAAFHPKALILYERYENNLYSIANDLAQRKHISCPVYSIVGDVTDAQRIATVMVDFRPNTIFHAAAHKHVPLMEDNPCEAVKNNVIGTRMMAEAAEKYGAVRFVFISTDKAVHPANVMGATKRIAEMLIQRRESGTCVYTIVRFGNVLGSNGSVVPLFLSQIQAGGPLTVTHPEMKRYFMLIPEAVQLVLHAASLAKGGEIFVLDMGEQINILEMARNLIRLSGYIPEVDIPIAFTGIRPGEKLYEELVSADEVAEPLPVEKILRISSSLRHGLDPFASQLEKLERAALQGDTLQMLTRLSEMLPSSFPLPDSTRFAKKIEAPS